MVDKTNQFLLTSDGPSLNSDIKKDLSNTSSSLRACIEDVMGPATITNPDDPGDDGMSKMEMQQIISSQRREIDFLTQKVQRMERERENMVDNFKLSSGVLLERIKDLEV